MADDTQTPVAELSYEQARDELVALVARIESGQAPLEESMVLWERGEALAAHCQAKLDQAQTQLDSATSADTPQVRDDDDDADGSAQGAESAASGDADGPEPGSARTEKA